MVGLAEGTATQVPPAPHHAANRHGLGPYVAAGGQMARRAGWGVPHLRPTPGAPQPRGRAPPGTARGGGQAVGAAGAWTAQAWKPWPRG